MVGGCQFPVNVTVDDVLHATLLVSLGTPIPRGQAQGHSIPASPASGRLLQEADWVIGRRRNADPLRKQASSLAQCFNFSSIVGYSLHSFDLGSGGSGAPLHGSRGLVAAPVPGGVLSDQRVGVGDEPLQALPDQDAIFSISATLSQLACLACVPNAISGACGRPWQGHVGCYSPPGWGILRLSQTRVMRSTAGKCTSTSFLRKAAKSGGWRWQVTFSLGQLWQGAVIMHRFRGHSLVLKVLADHLSSPGDLRGAHMCMQSLGQLLHAGDRVAEIHGAL